MLNEHLWPRQPQWPNADEDQDWYAAEQLAISAQLAGIKRRPWRVFAAAIKRCQAKRMASLQKA